ncbi:MAG: TetR/AcrR family transcriptional regulator [Hyphomicrobiales bacterium]|nr:TetR/AcrR family transcriptional regulator [Hyphomicrobiales bacterium]
MVETILEATQKLLGEIGFEAANTTRVAERAGISIGSLYQYFPDRDAIIAELRRRHHTHASATMVKAFADAEDMPLETAVRRLVWAVVDLHRHDPELHRILSEVVPPWVNFESRHTLQADIEAAQQRWLKAISMQISIADINIAGMIFRELVESTIHAAVLHGPSSRVDDTAEEVSRMIIAYLRLGDPAVTTRLAAE